MNKKQKVPGTNFIKCHRRTVHLALLAIVVQEEDAKGRTAKKAIGILEICAVEELFRKITED